MLDLKLLLRFLNKVVILGAFDQVFRITYVSWKLLWKSSSVESPHSSAPCYNLTFSFLVGSAQFFCHTFSLNIITWASLLKNTPSLCQCAWKKLLHQMLNLPLKSCLILKTLNQDVPPSTDLLDGYIISLLWYLSSGNSNPFTSTCP